MHLNLVDSYQMNLTVDACDSYEWNGVTYNTPGVYENIFSSIHGCDSIVTMQLNLYPSYHITTSGSGCDIFEWEGVTYTESGDYLLGEYQTVHGCDSIRMLSVLIGHAPQPSNIEGPAEVDVRLEPESSYSIAQSVELATCIWAIEPEEAGTINHLSGYEVTISWSDSYKGEATLQAYESNTCGEILNKLHVNVKNSTGVDESGIKANIYPNPTDGLVNIEAEGLQRITVTNALGQIVYDTETEGDMTRVNMKHFGAGMYVIRIYTRNGMGFKKITVTK